MNKKIIFLVILILMSFSINFSYASDETYKMKQKDNYFLQIKNMYDELLKKNIISQEVYNQKVKKEYFNDIYIAWSTPKKIFDTAKKDKKVFSDKKIFQNYKATTWNIKKSSFWEINLCFNDIYFLNLINYNTYIRYTNYYKNRIANSKSTKKVQYVYEKWIYECKNIIHTKIYFDFKTLNQNWIIDSNELSNFYYLYQLKLLTKNSDYVKVYNEAIDKIANISLEKTKK